MDDLAERVLALEPRDGAHERRALHREQAALVLDGLLVRVVRGQGALDLALGRDLAALKRGGLQEHLGYVRIADYARERLGLPEGTTREMIRLADGVAELPALRAAVWDGTVEASKALAILPVVRPEDEAEWVARARTETVRALRARVREARGGAPPDDEALGPMERITATMTEDDRRTVDEAFEVVRQIEGSTAPKWKLLMAMAAEFLSSFPTWIDTEDGPGEGPAGRDGAGDGSGQMSGDGVGGGGGSGQMSGEASGRGQTSGGAACAGAGGRRGGAARPRPRRRATGLHTERLPEAWVDECRAWLEDWTERWSFLEQDLPYVPGVELSEKRCAFALDDRLRQLARMRERWGELVGRLALLLRMHALWRDMQFQSFRHYVNDRLSTSARAIEQRAWLERRFFELPGLREALRDGRINYNHALVLAKVGCPEQLENQIAWASTHTVKELRRELESAERDRQMSGGELTVNAPAVAVDLLCEAIFTAQCLVIGQGTGWIGPGKAIAFIARHVLGVWKGRTGGPRGARKRIFDRHDGTCSVPVCTLPADEEHHIQFRSRGGGHEEENRTGLCYAHHHRGVHGGKIRVTGRAGERMIFELGLRGGRPREVFVRTC